jgi:hypothetical protein
MVKHCVHWNRPLPERETPAIKAGQFVTMPLGVTDKDAPSLLTMMFGSMGELLTAVDLVGRRFQKAGTVNAVSRAKYLERINSLLDGKITDFGPVKLDIPGRVDRLPRLLLHGETGVGETLIARYLHKRSGFTGRPLRILIPEYLGKEDMFEYDFFGYMRGAYTDAKKPTMGCCWPMRVGWCFWTRLARPTPCSKQNYWHILMITAFGLEGGKEIHSFALR